MPDEKPPRRCWYCGEPRPATAEPAAPCAACLKPAERPGATAEPADDHVVDLNRQRASWGRRR